MNTLDVRSKLIVIRIAIEKTVAEAEKDGRITDEEAKIITIARRKLGELEKLVDGILADNIVTQDESNELIDFEEKLMSDIYEQATADGKIDKDEMNMLKVLFQSIDPKASLDWLEEDK